MDPSDEQKITHLRTLGWTEAFILEQPFTISSTSFTPSRKEFTKTVDQYNTVSYSITPLEVSADRNFSLTQTLDGDR